MLQNIHVLIKGFLFHVSEMKSLDKYLVMLNLSKHLHQKIRQHAIVIAVTMLHILINRILSF